VVLPGHLLGPHFLDEFDRAWYRRDGLEELTVRIK